MEEHASLLSTGLNWTVVRGVKPPPAPPAPDITLRGP